MVARDLRTLIMAPITIGDITVGRGSPLAIIGGPCVIESADLCMQIGAAVRDRCRSLGLTYIFKASFDKANRSSVQSGRGPGADAGLRILQQVGGELGVPLTTDIHDPAQAAAAAKCVDLLQIPAFLCRQTDLLAAAAATARPVNIKKGQFMAPAEMANVIGKIETSAQQAGVAQGGVMLTERGTFFGYHRLVNDFAGLGDMMDLGRPVCFDATHSTQLPGQSRTSGGRPERAPLLAKAAVAAGVDAIFLETHPEPANAHSDAATMLDLNTTLNLLPQLARLREANTRD